MFSALRQCGGQADHNSLSQVIIDALKAASGRISGKGGAAECLELKRTTLQNKTRRLDITKAGY